MYSTVSEIVLFVGQGSRNILGASVFRLVSPRSQRSPSLHYLCSNSRGERGEGPGSLLDLVAILKMGDYSKCVA